MLYWLPVSNAVLGRDYSACPLHRWQKGGQLDMVFEAWRPEGHAQTQVLRISEHCVGAHILVP